MKNLYKFLLGLGLATCSLVGSASATDLSAQELLYKADEYRNFRGQSFTFDLTLHNYGPGATEQSFGMRAEILDPHTSLVVYTSPSSERGKALLMNNNNLWFHAPSNRKPIRITPQQRLLGEASNGDVASTDFSGDYTPKLLGKGEVEGVPCYQLELTTKPGSLAAYQRLHLWIRQDNFAPVKGDFFAPSGKPLKTAYYRRFERLPNAKDKEQLVEIEIVNALDAGKRTVMEYSNFEVTDLPLSRFNPSYLARLR